MYKVYVKTDGIGRIISVNSDAFLSDTTGWTQIDDGDGEGDKFPRNYLVYVHTNKENGKRYVGITRQNIKYRWRSDGSGYFRSPYFYNAILKYGWDNFEHDILVDNLTKQEAVDMEIDYIKKYKTQDKRYGYNMTAGGDGTAEYHMTHEEAMRRNDVRLGLLPPSKTTNQIKNRLSGDALRKVKSETKTRWLKEKWEQPKYREQIRKALTGRKQSEETKKKISEGRKGCKHSEETREKLRVLQLGHKSTEKQQEILGIGRERHKKPVYSINKTGGRTDYCSASEAAQTLGCDYLRKQFKVIAQNNYKVCECRWYYKGGS